MTLDEALSLMSEYYEDGNLCWKPDRNLEYLDYAKGTRAAVLDGDFTADELEAIAIIIRSTRV